MIGGGSIGLGLSTYKLESVTYSKNKVDIQKACANNILSRIGKRHMRRSNRMIKIESRLVGRHKAAVPSESRPSGYRQIKATHTGENTANGSQSKNVCPAFGSEKKIRSKGWCPHRPPAKGGAWNSSFKTISDHQRMQVWQTPSLFSTKLWHKSRAEAVTVKT